MGNLKQKRYAAPFGYRSSPESPSAHLPTATWPSIWPPPYTPHRRRHYRDDLSSAWDVVFSVVNAPPSARGTTASADLPVLCLPRSGACG